MSEHRRRHPVFGIVLGLLAGFMLPFSLGMASLMLLPALIVALLGVWSGIPAALAATASQLAMSGFMGYAFMTDPGSMSPAIFILVVAAMLLPGWGIIVLIRRRPGFYEGVKWSVGLTVGILFVAMAALWLIVRADLVDAMIAALHGYIAAQPAAITDLLLYMFAQAGWLGNSASVDFSRALSAADRTMLLERAMRVMSDTLKLNFAARLLGAGVLTGALGYWLSARVCARRGDDPIIEYRHPRDWRLSNSLILGPPLSALACYIAYWQGLSGADAAYVAFYNLSVLAFSIQGLAAIDRRMFRASVPPMYRAFVLMFGALLSSTILWLIGVLSALFGSEGLITKYVKRHSGKSDKGDDGE